MTDNQIAEGREAWAQIHRATDFASWKAVAVAVALGRQHSLRLANVNRPFGAKYARAFNAWLEANGFITMPYNLRVACCRLIDHLDEIIEWRAGLPDDVRASQNHPETIVRHWRRAKRATQKPSDAPLRQAVQGSRKLDKTTKVFWPQSAVRAAADAMRESRSTDWHKLARIALEAAVPDATALLDVLPDPPKPITRSTKPALAAMALSM